MPKIKPRDRKKIGFRAERGTYYAKLGLFGGAERVTAATYEEAIELYDNAYADFRSQVFARVPNGKTFSECVGEYKERKLANGKKEKIWISGFMKEYQDDGWKQGRVQKTRVTAVGSQLLQAEKFIYLKFKDEASKQKSFGDMLMADFSVLELQKSLQSVFKDAGKSTRNQKVISLKMVFDWAIQNDILKVSPMDKVILKKIKKIPKERVRIAEPVLHEVIDNIKNIKMRVCAITAALTGMRPGELAGLHWQEVNFGDEEVNFGDEEDTGSIVVKYGRQLDGTLGSGKTERARRSMPMASAVKKALKKWKLRQPPKECQQDLVFPNVVGNIFDNTKWNEHYLYPACRQANVRKFTWYDLRHYYASYLIYETTASDAEITYWMGHHSISFTQTVYAHWLNDPRRNKKITVELDRQHTDWGDTLKFGRVI